MDIFSKEFDEIMKKVKDTPYDETNKILKKATIKTMKLYEELKKKENTEKKEDNNEKRSDIPD